MGGGVALEHLRVDAGVLDVGQSADAERQVRRRVARIGADMERVRGQVGQGALHVAVEPERQVRHIGARKRLDGLEVETGVTQVGVDEHLVAEFGEIGEVGETERDVAGKVGVPVVEAQALDRQAGTVEFDVAAQPVELEAAPHLLERQVLDPGGCGFPVLGVPHREV